LAWNLKSRWSLLWPVLTENRVPNLPACVMLSRPTASNRQPSRDGPPSPPRSAARTNQDAPAKSPVPASTFPRHYPCQQRLISPVGANVLGPSSMGSSSHLVKNCDIS